MPRREWSSVVSHKCARLITFREVPTGPDLPQIIVLDRRRKSGARRRATDVKEPFRLSLGLRVAFSGWTSAVGTFKTWRGYLFSILITSACAWVESLDVATGLVFSLAVLLGDSVTSFFKCALGLVSGGHAPGLDQGARSLLRSLVVQHRFDLGLSGILGVVLTFIILNLIFWRYYRPVPIAG